MMTKSLLLTVLAVVACDAVKYNGVEVYPLASYGMIDRPYRYTSLQRLLKKKDSFIEYCNTSTALYYNLNHEEGDQWLRNFCKIKGEEAACNEYFKNFKENEKRLKATIEYYQKKNKWTKDMIALMDRVQLYHNNPTIPLEGECFATNGIKYTATPKQRKVMKLTIENCDFRRQNIEPDFAKRTCFKKEDHEPWVTLLQ
ncbi:unnamed protein product [Bursaphelenchus okinawaensis]|uniref:Uncharacterized protein n=1 Tax=Bursaphelenchus okinawaensis TaxID=465554 RepID=A0A811JVP7_9BILA|nr:unnamed protein product [Bursaphelenchus okinawaensis]CAG9085230.1 unnamed protein product [Bursaphelenchus okinawaensis]